MRRQWVQAYHMPRQVVWSVIHASVVRPGTVSGKLRGLHIGTVSVWVLGMLREQHIVYTAYWAPWSWNDVCL